MNLKSLLTFLFSIVLLSCNNNGNLEHNIKQLQSRNIQLPLDSMLYYSIEKNPSQEDSLSFYQKNLSLVVYADSTTCSSCEMKSLYKWLDFIDEIKAHYKNKVKIYFIFSVNNADVNLLNADLKMSVFDYPVFIDTSNVFIRHNSHIPKEKAYHVFLLDEEQNVILVGNPLNNDNIKKLLYKVVDSQLMKLH